MSSPHLGTAPTMPSNSTPVAATESTMTTTRAPTTASTSGAMGTFSSADIISMWSIIGVLNKTPIAGTFIKLENSSVYFERGESNYEEAKAICEQLDSKLVEFWNEAELVQVANLTLFKFKNTKIKYIPRIGIGVGAFLRPNSLLDRTKRYCVGGHVCLGVGQRVVCGCLETLEARWTKRGPPPKPCLGRRGLRWNQRSRVEIQ